MILEVTREGLLPGDRLEAYWLIYGGGWQDVTSVGWTVTRVAAEGIYCKCPANPVELIFDGPPYVSTKYRVVRLSTVVVRADNFGPKTAEASKPVADWPLSCPKCKRAASAYLGLNSYDCKHGCFKAGAR